MTELAIYDMDRTITRTGTYTPFLIYAARRLAPWRLVFVPLVPLVMLVYALKLIDRARLKEITQRLLLGEWLAPARLAPVAEAFADRMVAMNVHPGALRQIAEDRAAGRRLVMATASYKLYVAAIAHRLGFVDVIATGSVLGLDARVRARIDGENVYGEAKLRMIERWLADQGIARATASIRFYSDHVSDKFALEWADEPFAVNPSARLKRLAEARGWPVVDWGF